MEVANDTVLAELKEHQCKKIAEFAPEEQRPTVEAKATKDTERITTFTTPEGWEPSSVPTLEYERVITEDGAAAVNSNDIMGTRVRVDYAAVPGEFTPYVAAAYLIDKDTGGLHFNNSPENILHPMVGVEWSKNHRAVQLNAGHRIDQRQDAAEGADRIRQLQDVSEVEWHHSAQKD